MAEGKKAGHGPELIQRTRKAVLNTFDAIEKKGKLISEILAEEFEKNPIKFMELAAKLMPKEHTGSINHTHEQIDNMSREEIESELAEIRRLSQVLAEAQGSTRTKPEKESGKTNIH